MEWLVDGLGEGGELVYIFELEDVEEVGEHDWGSQLWSMVQHSNIQFSSLLVLGLIQFG